MNVNMFLLWIAGWFIASALGAALTFFLLSGFRRDGSLTDIYQMTPDIFRIINLWVVENSWYEEPELSKLAQYEYVRLLSEYPHLSLEENLAMVAAEMRKKFPERCGGKLN